MSDIREALREQSPSLALQRAAADEIARLDHKLAIIFRSATAQPHDVGCTQHPDTPVGDPNLPCSCGRQSFIDFLETA